MAAQLTLIQQAIFDKPVKHQHLKALYVKGFVDGKPMSKILVDRGASINMMPYTTFRKLGKGPEDLIETTMMLKDFGGNVFKTKGAINVELTIGNYRLVVLFMIKICTLFVCCDHISYFSRLPILSRI